MKKGEGVGAKLLRTPLTSTLIGEKTEIGKDEVKESGKGRDSGGLKTRNNIFGHGLV